MTSSKFMKDNINISRFSTVLLLTVCIISAKFLFARTDVSSQTEAAEDGASEVYSRLYSEFAKYPHRLAGSENLENCFKAIEREFESAGIEPRRQTFMTLVQETEYCKFSYDGVQLDDVYITDNLAPFVMDKPISCPVVYIGNGTIKEIDGKDLKGAIAVVDATLPEASLRDAPDDRGESNNNSWRCNTRSVAHDST